MEKLENCLKEMTGNVLVLSDGIYEGGCVIPEGTTVIGYGKVEVDGMVYGKDIKFENVSFIGGKHTEFPSDQSEETEFARLERRVCELEEKVASLEGWKYTASLV